MENNRNFFITIALSILVLTLWQVFYLGPKTEAQREQTRIEEQQRQTQQAAQGGSQGDTPQMPGTSGAIPGQSDGAAAGGTLTREAAAAQSQRVDIDTVSLRGSINLTGARLDDLYLKKYHETVDNKSPEIELLAPSALKQGYFVELGFTGNEATGEVPGPNTVWTVEGNNKLTASTPVTLTYTNDKNITFKRVISVDDAYMFAVDDTVTNNTGAPISLASYGRVTRFNQPEHASATYVLHEGLIGVMGQDGLQEIKYSKVEDDKDISFKDVTGGWVGITDKYWQPHSFRHRTKNTRRVSRTSPMTVRATSRISSARRSQLPLVRPAPSRTTSSLVPRLFRILRTTKKSWASSSLNC